MTTFDVKFFMSGPQGTGINVCVWYFKRPAGSLLHSCIPHFLLFTLCLLLQELDHEELKEIKLQVSVANKAQYHSSVVVTESKTYTVHVSVVNQPEGPRFNPAVKVITISEESTSTILNKVITNYAAIDSDTLLIANNVRCDYRNSTNILKNVVLFRCWNKTIRLINFRYAKGRDVDNWLIIDERTADIRLNKIPDFESKFLINGTYYTEIICITNGEWACGDTTFYDYAVLVVTDYVIWIMDYILKYL